MTSAQVVLDELESPGLPEQENYQQELEKLCSCQAIGILSYISNGLPYCRTWLVET